jgi:serine/threonine protein kinase
MRISVVGVGYATPAMPVHGSAAPTLAVNLDEDLPPGSQAGEYVIERKLGEGGMGAVYGARHPLIGKRAAIKVIKRELSASQEAVDRFIREAQAVNQIGHPNIVDVFGFGRLPDGRSFFVMEWLEGESLRDRMLRPLPFPEALEYLETIAMALQAAHEAGVLHRDLKPDNVFLWRQKADPRPRVKLLDFGLAKLSGGGGDNRIDHTRTGIVMGTPLYLSPEQAKGMKVDLPTDVYSLGAMAYEMLTGVVPFKADSAVEIMAMHISRPAMPLRQIAPWMPLDLEQLVLGMLGKDPARRPTIAQVHQAFSMIRAKASNIQGTPTTYSMGAPTPPWTPSPPTHSQLAHTPAPGYGQSSMLAGMPPQRSRRGLFIALAAFVLLGAGIAVAVVMSQGKSKDKDANQPQVAAADPASTTHVDSPPPQPAHVDPPQPPQPPQPAHVDPPQPPQSVNVDPPQPPHVDPPQPAQPAHPAHVDPPHSDSPKLGSVVVTIDGPAKAMILVDGKPLGRQARAVVELAPGNHVVRAQAPGFKPAEAKVHIDASGRETVKLTLEKRPASTNAVHDPFDE